MKALRNTTYQSRTTAIAVLLMRLQRYQFIMTALLQAIRVIELRCPNETRTHAARLTFTLFLGNA